MGMINNVLVLTKLFPSEYNPNYGVFVKNFLDNFSRYNKANNFVVIRALPFGLNFKINFFIKGKQFISLHPLVKKNENYKVFYPRIISFGKYLFNYHHIFYLRSLKLLIKKNKLDFDIIHAHWLYPDGYVAVKLGKLLNIPVIVHCRGSDINSLLLNKKLKCYNDYTIKESEIILVVSNDLKKKILDKYPDTINKLHVINNGIDLSAYRDLESNSSLNIVGLKDNISNRIVFVGNVLSEKGIIELLEAIKLLSQTYRDFRLYIIGKGSRNIIRQINKYISTENLNEYISLIGECENIKIKHWFNIADLTVLPSHSEGLPNVILESLAARTPVIATNVGGIPEIITNELRGKLIPPHNSQAIAKAIGEFFSTKKERNLAFNEIEGFDVKYQIQKLSKIYQNLINDH